MSETDGMMTPDAVVWGSPQNPWAPGCGHSAVFFAFCLKKNGGNGAWGGGNSVRGSGLSGVLANSVKGAIVSEVWPDLENTEMVSEEGDSQRPIVMHKKNQGCRAINHQNSFVRMLRCALPQYVSRDGCFLGENKFGGIGS